MVEYGNFVKLCNSVSRFILLVRRLSSKNLPHLDGYNDLVQNIASKRLLVQH